jgi:hypothetical protein
VGNRVPPHAHFTHPEVTLVLVPFYFAVAAI